MTWKEWRSVFRFERNVNIPHASITAMTPYFFVRGMWYFCPREHHAWPSRYETGVVIGWRWPWRKQFREKSWIDYRDMPLALYRAMDQTYGIRAAKELKWIDDNGRLSKHRAVEIPYIAPTIREMGLDGSACSHNYWLASCPNCARKALTLAVRLTAKHQSSPVPDPREDPLTAFRRREAEAQRLMAVHADTDLPESTE